jgi:hypothetical protein
VGWLGGIGKIVMNVTFMRLAFEANSWAEARPFSEAGSIPRSTSQGGWVFRQLLGEIVRAG